MPTYQRILLTVLVCCYFWHAALTYADWHFIDYVNLIFHEAGHTIFYFFGMFIKIAAGSAFQIMLPLALALSFFRTKQKVSGALCLLWVGQNFLNVSIYAADASVMQLDLLGGDSVIHDWNYLLGAMELLGHAAAVGLTLRIIGIAIIFVGTALAVAWASEKEESI